MWWFAWCRGRRLQAGVGPRPGVGDGQGQGFELGDQGASRRWLSSHCR